MKESYSWSKPKEVLNIIGRKHVDWSIFEGGSTIPSEFHEDFDKANGIHVKRGEKRELKLIYKGRTYQAIFLNLNRKNIKSETYQIRYDSNKKLKELLTEIYFFSYKYLNAAREKARLEGKKKVFAIVPNEQAEFIDFCSTGRPFEYEIILHPFTGGILYDENYQEEIETSFHNKLVEYLDIPKNKISKRFSNSCSYKRDKVVGRNAIISANFLCEVNNSHEDFISKVTGKNYVEAHHLIPIEFQGNFEVSIDVEANVVSLCSKCHKKLHHAIFNEKQRILGNLFEQRKERLKLCGISLSEELLLSYYR
ncbi:HNH endonuclease [Niallia sp. BSM11]|uniref:HNH endonuclease n=1 Tax=Niallia sp. BSM11 TaxID=3391576 RepID=UPI00398533F1